MTMTMWDDDSPGPAEFEVAQPLRLKQFQAALDDVKDLLPLLDWVAISRCRVFVKRPVRGIYSFSSTSFCMFLLNHLK